MSRPTPLPRPDPPPADEHAIGVPRMTLQEATYRRLREGLMRGEFVPGQALTVRILTELVGTSPMPVREALRRLASERAVEIMGNGTTRVRWLDPTQRAQLMGIRATLEGMAAREAAERVTRREVRALEHLHAREMRELGRRDLRAAAATNQEFHFAIYRAAGNAELMALIETLWVQMGPTLMDFMLRVAAEGDDVVRVLEGYHPALLTALRAGDGAAAEAALRRDLGTIPL